MTSEQIVLNEIQKHIAGLPPEDSEAIEELASFFRMNMKRAGSPIGELTIALIGAELQLKNSL